MQSVFLDEGAKVGLSLEVVPNGWVHGINGSVYVIGEAGSKEEEKFGWVSGIGLLERGE
jgi:hypothetical protein